MEDKRKVMSLRLDQQTYRRLHAYGIAGGMTDSAAARELIASGLARDGLELYSTELGAYLRGVMQPLIEGFDQTLEARNAEQEDRIARCVHRATRGSIVAAIAAVETAADAVRRASSTASPRSRRPTSTPHTTSRPA